jgi:hypothetical protein
MTACAINAGALSTSAPKACKARPAPLRAAKVLVPGSPDSPASFIQVEATIGRKLRLFWYWVTPLPADLGRAFLVEKSSVDPTYGTEAGQYAVNLGGDGQAPSCECLGFLRWGTLCKHLIALQALVDEGKL